jgi:ketosteroid isomerase-like protein
VTGAEPGLYGTPGEVDREVATVRAIYDAFARRDVEGMLRHVADDCELVLPGTAELVGRTEPYVGPSGVRQYFADAMTVWSQLTLHAEDIRAAADGVAVFGHVEAVHETGTLRRRVLWIWQLRDGKAAKVRANDLGPLA